MTGRAYSGSRRSGSGRCTCRLRRHTIFGQGETCDEKHMIKKESWQRRTLLTLNDGFIEGSFVGPLEGWTVGLFEGVWVVGCN